MADGKGFQVIVKINLPPEADYHSGHSLMLQGDTPGEVRQQIAKMIVGPGNDPDENAYDQAQFILLRFIEFAQKGAVQAALAAPQTSEADVDDGSAGRAAAPPSSSGGSEPASDDLASPALLKVVAKKTNMPLEELEGYTTEAAKALLTKGAQ